MAKEVFISYSRTDVEKVKTVKEEIDRLVGINCWMDLNGIKCGSMFKKVIISAIKQHNTFLFMLTHHSMNSSFAKKELDFAESENKRIILVDLEHTQMNDEFRFDYSGKDNIDWNDKSQHDKLISDLKSWFCGISEDDRQNTIQYGVAIILKHFEGRNIESIELKGALNSAVSEFLDSPIFESKFKISRYGR